MDFKCSKCGATFRTRDELRQHIFNVHMGEGALCENPPSGSKPRAGVVSRDRRVIGTDSA